MIPRGRIADESEVVPGLRSGPRLTPDMVAADPYFSERPDDFYLEIHDLYLQIHGSYGNELALDLWMTASALHATLDGTAA